MKKISLFALALAVLLIGTGCQNQKQEQVTSLPPAETQTVPEKQKESVGKTKPVDAATNTDPIASVSVDKNFRITNIANWNPYDLGDPSAIFPIHVYGCDIYDIKNGIPLHYSKIDFFISKDGENAPAIFLGTTPPGGAGSGECNLYEDESSLKSKLEPGKYRFWAVRYIENKPDKRTPAVLISIVES